jgi:uncharacterized membrane protein
LERKTTIILSILLVIALGVITYLLLNPRKSQPETVTVEVIKYRRDSVLVIVNDTIVKEINKVNEEYEKTNNELLTMPPDKQCDVLSDYISKNAWRLSGNNNK